MSFVVQEEVSTGPLLRRDAELGKDGIYLRKKNLGLLWTCFVLSASPYPVGGVNVKPGVHTSCLILVSE